MNDVICLCFRHPQTPIGRACLVLIVTNEDIILPETDWTNIPVATAIERFVAADKAGPFGHLDSLCRKSANHPFLRGLPTAFFVALAAGAAFAFFLAVSRAVRSMVAA